MKIDVKCNCGDVYMNKVSFTPSKFGEIGTLEFQCRKCGNRVYLELDI